MTTPHLDTKFPKIGTTIFTVMSALATEKNAVNLGQGFPDFDCDPKLVACVNAVSYTHLRAHETRHDLVCRLLLEKSRDANW